MKDILSPTRKSNSGDIGPIAAFSVWETTKTTSCRHHCNWFDCRKTANSGIRERRWAMIGLPWQFFGIPKTNDLFNVRLRSLVICLCWIVFLNFVFELLFWTVFLNCFCWFVFLELFWLRYRVVIFSHCWLYDRCRITPRLCRRWHFVWVKAMAIWSLVRSLAPWLRVRCFVGYDKEFCVLSIEIWCTSSGWSLVNWQHEGLPQWFKSSLAKYRSELYS